MSLSDEWYCNISAVFTTQPIESLSHEKTNTNENGTIKLHPTKRRTKGKKNILYKCSLL